MFWVSRTIIQQYSTVQVPPKPTGITIVNIEHWLKSQRVYWTCVTIFFNHADHILLVNMKSYKPLSKIIGSVTPKNVD